MVLSVKDGAPRHEPLRVLAPLYGPLLEKLPAPADWERAVRDAAAAGPLVHVLRTRSLVDGLAVNHLSARLGLPPVGFANDLDGWSVPRLPAPLERLVGPPASPPTPAALLGALESGASALLFLKHPPGVLDRAGRMRRGRSEGDPLIRGLFELQRRGGPPVQLLPEVLVWTLRPERQGFSLVDTLFGPTESPGELRAVAQFLLNHDHCVIRAADPIALDEFLRSNPGEPDEVLVRRLTYALLRRLERERRAVVGPVRKPADRVREEVVRTPKLQGIIRDLAGEGSEEQAVLTEKALHMLRKMAAAPDAETQKGLELLFRQVVDRVYAGVDVDLEGLERVREAGRRGSLVLLPSHKSHIDYMILSYIMRTNALSVPVVAAGDNLAFFPVGPLFRRAGAFFIRRSFKGDRLYATVVDAYIRRLMRDGWPIEFFLEGGRSRTGKLLPPKLGLLNMVVEAALSLRGREVYFVPISIGYERMMEEGAYAEELSGGEKRKEDAAGLLGVARVLRNKYGRVSVQFGQIVSLDEVRRRLGVEGEVLAPARRRLLVSRLAHLVMSEINRVTLVTPGALVALVLLGHARRGIAHLELHDRCARLARLLARDGARLAPALVRPDGTLRPQAVREAAVLFVRAELVTQHVPGDTLTGKARRRAAIYTGDDVIYTVPNHKRLLLDLSKNHIVHFFVDRALVALALLAPPGPPLAVATLRERVQTLSRLFKYEFMFRADASFDAIFDETLLGMTRAGELAREGETIGFGPGHDGLDGRGWTVLFASTVRNFVESYQIAARTLGVLARGGVLAERELVKRALRIGEQMFLGGEIERSEAVSRPVLENAFASFADQGYLEREGGKVRLTASFSSEEAAAAVEARLAAFLNQRRGDAEP